MDFDDFEEKILILTKFEETNLIFFKSLNYKSNFSILKLPIPLYYTKKFNHRFFVYCKMIIIKGRGFFQIWIIHSSKKYIHISNFTATTQSMKEKLLLKIKLLILKHITLWKCKDLF